MMYGQGMGGGQPRPNSETNTQYQPPQAMQPRPRIDYRLLFQQRQPRTPRPFRQWRTPTHDYTQMLAQQRF